MTGAPRLGLLTHASSGTSERAMIDDAIALCISAEALGFHSVWIAQHHFSAEGGAVPSPLIFLAAVATHTKHIRLGTAVITLALEDPIRTAEDAALVDLISGGRLELGIGSGAHPPTFTAMSRDFSRRADDSNVNAGVLAALLAGDALPGGSVVSPQPHGLDRRIWRATSSRKAAALAGQLGHGILLARSAPLEMHSVGAVQHPLTVEYRHVSELNGHIPRIAVSRTIIPGDDAADHARTASAARVWAAQERLPESLSRLDDAGVLARHGVITGSPARIADTLHQDPAVGSATDLLVQFQPAHLGLEASVDALTTIVAATDDLKQRRS